jgi:hypothetical protein
LTIVYVIYVIMIRSRQQPEGHDYQISTYCSSHHHNVRTCPQRASMHHLWPTRRYQRPTYSTCLHPILRIGTVLPPWLAVPDHAEPPPNSSPMLEARIAAGFGLFLAFEDYLRLQAPYDDSKIFLYRSEFPRPDGAGKPLVKSWHCACSPHVRGVTAPCYIQPGWARHSSKPPTLPTNRQHCQQTAGRPSQRVHWRSSHYLSFQRRTQAPQMNCEFAAGRLHIDHAFR